MSCALVALFVVVVCCVPASRQQAVDFQTPDVTAVVPTDRGSVHVEAFKVEHGRSGKKPTMSKWVSLGAPKIVRSQHRKKLPPVTSVTDAFEFDDNQMSVWIGLLSPALKSALVKAAKAKHNEKKVDVLAIRPSLVNCSMEIKDDAGKTHVLNGSASPHQVPFRVHFKVRSVDAARRIVQERVLNKSTDGVSMQCTFQVLEKNDEAEVFQAGLNVAQKRQITTQLFGRKGPVAVTVRQLRVLGSKVHGMQHAKKTTDKTEVDYVNELVNRTMKHGLSEHEPVLAIDDALESLSRFEANVTDASAVKKDLNSLLKVDKATGFVGFNDASKNDLLHRRVLSSLPRSPKKLLLHWFIRLGALENVLDGKNSSSLADQLDKMNHAEDNDVIWRVDGDAVVADKLRAVRLYRPLPKQNGLFRFNRRLHSRTSFSRTTNIIMTLEDNKSAASHKPTATAAAHHSTKHPTKAT